MVDVEAAFLEADLDEDVYIIWPKGLVELGYFEEKELFNTCAKLDKAMYGCVQSPRAFFKELCKKLREMKMVQCKTDPCIWFDNAWKPTLIVACYVDNIIITGNQDKIDWFKTELKNRFKLTELGKLKKHLGILREENFNKWNSLLQV